MPNLPTSRRGTKCLTSADRPGRKRDERGRPDGESDINFFATWCGPCNSKWPRVEKDLWQVFNSEADFEMISVGREHSKAELVAFTKQKNIASPIAPDPRRGVYGLFAEKYIPRSVIVGPDGTVLHQSVGYSPEKIAAEQRIVREALAELGDS